MSKKGLNLEEQVLWAKGYVEAMNIPKGCFPEEDVLWTEESIASAVKANEEAFAEIGKIEVGDLQFPAALELISKMKAGEFKSFLLGTDRQSFDLVSARNPGQITALKGEVEAEKNMRIDAEIKAEKLAEELASLRALHSKETPKD